MGETRVDDTGHAGGGSVLSELVYTGINVPQSGVLGHVLASGLVSGSQLEVLQVTAPGVPDLPAATPHFVAHPLGSACFQLPNSGCEMIRKANLKNRDTALSQHHRRYTTSTTTKAQDRVRVCWLNRF